MARADTSAVVAVEVFVEQDEIAPERIALEYLRAAVDGPPAVLIAQEDAREPPRALRGPPPQVERRRRARRERDLERVAVEVVELLQRLDQQVVDREPDGAAPVRVAPEEPARGLRRLGVHPRARPANTG